MYLENIKAPKDIKKLNIDELKCLCSEIREKLIKTVSEKGGHLASNLGVVELTVGMHYVFDCPNDSFLFDVGHQSYAHKMLTGRYDDFDTIRQENGISGFMNPEESKYDAFISGHSSNSVSAACGIAKANTLDSNNNFVVNLIGDGAMTGGMFFEGLNNAGITNDKLVIVINDNKMSISKNVGGLQVYLNNLRSSSDYIRRKEVVKNRLQKIPALGSVTESVIRKSKNLVKRIVYKSNFFEFLGFHSLGPVDGNNLEVVIDTLKAAKHLNGPVVVHTCTVKGKGYNLAEKHPNNYHGVGSFNVDRGYKANSNNFSNVFGEHLAQLAERDRKICAVTAAMTEGTGLSAFRDRFKKRFFDVGIAEQHAVTFCSGLACKGYKPVFAVYSSFLQRGYDQIIHDAAIMNYNVTFAIDRAGIVGEDGVTHQGIFDVAFLNSIPNVKVYSPSYYDELKDCISLAINQPNVAAVRYPRGAEGYKPDWFEHQNDDFSIYKKSGKAVCVTYGREFSQVCKALENKNVDICKVLQIKPIPQNLVNELMQYEKIVVAEEGIILGGFGQMLSHLMLENGYKGEFVIKGFDDFVPHCNWQSALKGAQLDSEGITKIFEGELNGRENQA